MLFYGLPLSTIAQMVHNTRRLLQQPTRCRNATPQVHRQARLKEDSAGAHKDAAQLVEHPVAGRIESLQMLLWPARHAGRPVAPPLRLLFPGAPALLCSSETAAGVCCEE